MSRILELKGLGPLVLRKDEMQGDAVSLCRCGLSRDFPFCDGSHRATRGEAEGQTYRYIREVPSGKLVRIEAGPTQPAPPPAPEADPHPPSTLI